MKQEVISTSRSSRSNEAHFSKKPERLHVGGYRFERGSSVLKTVKFTAAAPTLSVKIVAKGEDFPERDRYSAAALPSTSRLLNSPNAPSSPDPLRAGTARAPFWFWPRRSAPNLPEQTRGGSNILHAVLLVAGLLLNSFQSRAAEGPPDASVTNSIVEQFKSFISSPPIIEELVWDLKVMPPGKKYNPEDGLGASTNYQRFIARWQPNARSVYQVFPEYVSTNTIMNWFSISVYDKKHWQLTPSGFLIFWHDDGALPGPKAELNLVKSGVDYLTYRLAEVLNMGVFNVGIGSIRWQGDTFSVTNSNIGLRFQGTLQVSPQGIPSHLNLRSEIGTNNRALTVRYSFEHNAGLSFLPHEIRVTEESNGRELERALIRIKSIRLASQPAAEEAFLPKTNVLTLPVQLRYYTNGAHYALDAKGRLVPAALGGRPPEMGEQRRIYLAACAVVSLAIFALMVRAKLKTNQNQMLRAELKKEMT